MTCAKKQVWAVLTTTDGKQYTGENSCLHPVIVCPRVKGEGYGKCQYVCRQPAHAEIDAMREAFLNGSPLNGGKMEVSHHRVCSDCQKTMTEAGITWETIE